jgi:chromate transporter
MLGGPVAAAVATLGMFLPAFLFVAASGPLVPRLRASRTAGAALDGVIAASLALMAAATLQLAQAAIVDPATAVIGVAAAIALLRFKVGPAWLLGAGAVAGILTRLIGG